MIDRQRLLSDLTKLLRHLQDDIRRRCDDQPDVDRSARAEWTFTREAGRTADDYTVWREGWITQAAAAWILGTAFVRFMEDNDLISPSLISGPGGRLAVARDCRTHYFNERPADSDRDYLLHVFDTVSKLPAAADIFDCRHNPIWRLGPTGDGATRLLEFWQRIDPASGTLAHDFTDPDLDTRFLGDLYQDLSEDARKKYALLQTPEFVEEFILDRTLTPAIEEFGYRDVRLIDPACGSGHFLLGAFRRLLDISQRYEPAVNVRELARRVLANVCGVDVNPFAVAIARFRLLVAALRACGIARLEQAPAFPLNVYTGDSLLHGKRFCDEGALQLSLDEDDPVRRALATEDAVALKRVLGHQYHAVVGNPPYITVKDRALNGAYRQRYRSCHMKYSLAVPFMERLFELAVAGERAGFVGMITSNSFMKREFGKKLIEQYIPRWDLSHVIDTSGAYIPGHGTPTVILFGRNRPPLASAIRTVMGIRGEPQTPDDAATGQVWSAVLTQIDQPGSESAFVSVVDMSRERFYQHPWSIGGGGATDLKAMLDLAAKTTLGSVATSIGITSFTLEDDVYLLPWTAARRHRLPPDHLREMIIGDAIRDWRVAGCDSAVFPYSVGFEPVSPPLNLLRYLWPYRTSLANNKMFGGETKVKAGLHWFEYGRLTADKLRTPLSIAFASVVTHNHFALDRGGKVFKQSAPVIKLPADAPEDDHLALLGLLNSSAACFWMKQVFYPKATAAGDISLEKGRPEANRYDIASTGLGPFPVPGGIGGMLVVITRELERLAVGRSEVDPARILEEWANSAGERRLVYRLQAAERDDQRSAERMVVLQEELDWECYHLYGLSDCGAEKSLVLNGDCVCQPGDRPFAWENGVVPGSLRECLRETYARRQERLLEASVLRLTEKAVYKRLWLGRQGVYGHHASTYRERTAEALREWLLDRVESSAYWPSRVLTTCAQLAEQARHDAEFMEVSEVYRGHAQFDVTKLVTELVMDEAVPCLPAQRYKESGLRKREVWERTWEMQRREDAIDARAELPEGHQDRFTVEQANAIKAREIGDIPVPPKYTSADFKSGPFWRLRGKLDVPKERFISYPGASRETDPSPVVAWAGWDYLQQAQALSAYYVSVKEQDGWSAERLQPLLAGLRELLPWLKQWHNDVDPETGLRLGDYFADFVDAEERALAGRW